MLPEEAPVYEAKYGFNRQSAKVIGIALFFCVIMLVVTAPIWARVFVVGFSGLGVLIMTAASLTRRTALRIDPTGIALCQSPLWPRSATFFPWEDVDKVLIWQFQRLSHVGVQRREGAAPLPKPIRSPTRAAIAITSPGIPLEAAATAAATNGWTLDKQRLAEAVARFAPAVEVVDLTTGRRLHPGPPIPD